MPIDANGNWYPNIFPKQIQIYNDFHRYVLVSGPRKSGKTTGCIHKIARHLWETPYPYARVGMFCKLMKTAKEGGVWDDLTKIVMPEWLNS